MNSSCMQFSCILENGRTLGHHIQHHMDSDTSQAESYLSELTALKHL